MNLICLLSHFADATACAGHTTSCPLQHGKKSCRTSHFLRSLIRLSLANKEVRLSVLVRGARLCHALLKALDSPLNYLARRHPKLKGYRLASHVSAYRRSKFSRDKVCNSLADPVGPPGGGSRHWAILPHPSERGEISIPNRRHAGK